MASQGRGHREGERSNNRRPSAFDQQAFIEDIVVATATIVQSSDMAATLHMLVQLGAKEGQVTSRRSRHTILQPSREKGTRW